MTPRPHMRGAAAALPRGNVLVRYTWRSLTRNRARTLASLLGVTLACALLTGIVTSITSLERAVVGNIAASEGTWQVFDSGQHAPGYERRLAADPRVAAALSSAELGVARLSPVTREDEPGDLIAVRTMPRVVAGTPGEAQALVIQPTVSLGRAPESADEVMLPDSLLGWSYDGGSGGIPSASADGPLNLGSTLTLPLGTRVDAETGEALSSDVPPRVGGIYLSGVDFELSGTLSELGLNAATEEPDEERLAERLVGVEERTFRVVGFYGTQWSGHGDYAASELSAVALTAPAGGPTSCDFVWLSTTCQTRAQIKALAEPLFGFEDYWLHTTLLSAQGMGGESPVWESLGWIVAILAVVVLAATVSLAGNALAISVDERTREFGLLATLGASRRQLRGAVLLEALMLGGMGIPLGLALGVAGVSLALHAQGENISTYLFNQDADALVVRATPQALGAVAALCLASLLASAAAPAVRAGRLPAAEAVRRSPDARLGLGSRLSIWVARRLGRPLPWRGLRAAVLGVPGHLASSNLRRRGSRGRVVVLSLGISVALVVAVGAMRSVIDPILQTAASYSAVGSGVDMAANLSAQSYAEEPDGSLRSLSGMEFSERLRALSGGLSKALAGSGRLVELRQVYVGSLVVTLPSGMLSDELRAQVDEAGAYGLVMDGMIGGGCLTTWGSTLFVDDATWAELLSRAGVGTTGGAALPALVVNRVDYVRDERLVSLTPLSATGTLRAYGLGRTADGTLYSGIEVDEDGVAWVYVEPGVEVAGGAWAGGHVTDADVASSVEDGLLRLPLVDAAADMADVAVVGLVDDVVDLLGAQAIREFPTVVMPEWAMGTSEALAGERAVVSYALVGGAHVDEARDELTEAAEGLFYLSPGLGYYWLSDVAGNAQQVRAVVEVISLFVTIFSAATTAMAVANAFVALSSNVGLRLGEFAALRSVGMDRRGLALMLGAECVSYGARGLALGLGSGWLALWLMWRALELSHEGVGLRVPWAYVAASVVGVAVVLGASVAHALWRGRHGAISDSLREQAV